ncbi:hypothetical protein WA026_009892 [Henosepilachna vigintioctopunctata]|uniref:Insulin-like domain-containing protein n=1 Tax=Henosepilachna vigintioctopunctata TaxID=420089 RepID=A0AAW1TQI8_9CUCU
MDTKIFIVSTIFCLLVGESSCNAYPRYKYCGTNLINALQSICKSQPHLRSKKSVDYNQEYSNENSAVDNSERYGENMLQPMESFGRLLTAFNSKHRTKRGIHEDCCLNGCTRDELISYCY